MFKNLLNKVKSIFNKKARQPEKVVIAPKLSKLNIKKVGIVVGHNEKKQGAVNFLNESEFSFFKKVSGYMPAFLYELEACIFFRNKWLTYSRQCKDIAKRLLASKVDIAIMLHFNAGGGNGTEMLIPSNNILDAEDRLIAEKIAEFINKEFGFKLRGVNGVKECKSGHNGFKMIHEANKAGIPCLIFEGCFGDNDCKMTREFFTDPKRVAKAISEAIKSI